MTRKLSLFAAVFGAFLLAFGVYTSTASSHAGKKTAQIRIESWLHGFGDPNGQSGTVKDCLKIMLDGKVFDRAGVPTWKNSSEYVTTSNPCAAEGPAGGYVMLPAATTGPPLSTVYAVHTIAAEKGNIFITFSGSYNFTGTDVTVSYPDSPTTVQPYHCVARWVITGGTGAYRGIQGEGTTGTVNAPCAINLDNGLILHTSVGQVSWR
ncbi:MAG: hypothetical protein ABSC51_10380 [Gaiellaceae bacterium]|jgi:hypothetical protein